MATIITKNSSTASSVPLAAQLVQGELAVNVTDKRLFTENSGGTVVELGTTPSSLSTGALAYTGTLTGGTGVVNLGSGQVYKDASGNVGVGMTPTNFGNGYTVLQVANASNGGMLYLTNTANAGGRIYGNGAGLTYDAFSTTYHAFNTNGTERARIDSSGNLGIGTSSPLTPLHVVGAIQSQRTGGVSQYARMVNSGGTATFISDNQASGTYTGFQFQGLSTASGTPTTYATIDGSGNLLVGKSSNVVTTAGVNIFPTGDIYSVGAGSTDFDNMRFYRNGSASTVGRITTTSTTTSYVTSSDYRLKEDITPMTGALAKVAALKPVSYKWKSDGSDSQGFIAHELQAVVPECVTGEKDAVDADGKPQYQGIDTSFLVATLTAAIQELKAIVDAQAVEIAALKAI